MNSATRVLEYAKKPDKKKTLLLQLLKENVHKDDTDDEDDWMCMKSHRVAKKRIAVEDCNDLSVKEDDELKPAAKLLPPLLVLEPGTKLPLAQDKEEDEEVPVTKASGSSGDDDDTETNNNDEVVIVTGNPEKPAMGICYPLQNGSNFEMDLLRRCKVIPCNIPHDFK